METCFWHCLDWYMWNTYLLTYLLTHLLTYSLTHSLTHSLHGAESFLKLTGSAAGQEIPRISWNPKVHHRTHKCPPPVPILSQLHSVPATPSHFLQVHLNIILPSTSGSPQWSLSLRDICEIAKKTFSTCDHHIQGVYITLLLLDRELCQLLRNTVFIYIVYFIPLVVCT